MGPVRVTSIGNAPVTCVGRRWPSWRVLVATLACAGVLGVTVVPRASAAAPPVIGCAWTLQTGSGGGKSFDADLNASYWVTTFFATPGAGLILSGGFPAARYMSISAYNSAGAANGVHFYDAQIQPATGQNRFQSGVSTSATGTYQVQILAASPPANPAPNTLYVGQNNALVTVMYRVYDSNDPSDASGGVGPPQVSNTSNGTVTATRGGCVLGSSLAGLLGGLKGVLGGLGGLLGGLGGLLGGGSSHADSANAALGAAAAPTWTVANVTRYPNTDAAYLEAAVNRSPGQVLVIRAQTPTFPNTNAGVPPWTPEQVRYWSFCEEGKDLGNVSGCLADHAVIESGGVATFVLSSAADQPTNATVANGINWLQWRNGSAGFVIYRQILAVPAFTQSIAAIPPGGSIPAAMGPYYPQIAYCSVAEFEAAGAAGCLPAN